MYCTPHCKTARHVAMGLLYHHTEYFLRILACNSFRTAITRSHADLRLGAECGRVACTWLHTRRTAQADTTRIGKEENQVRLRRSPAEAVEG